jgi:hypothetical protein
MTKHLRNLFGLALLVAAISASAQITDAFHVKVPFPFVAAGQTLPAADYKVQITHATGLVILTAPGMAPAMRITTKDYRPAEADKAYLRFQRSGECWILQEVMLDGAAQVFTVGRSERELVKLRPSDRVTLSAPSVVAH